MSAEKKIYRVLIIDDAFFIRNLIKRAILNKPDDDSLNYKFDVVGEAINGKEGLIHYFNLKPDLITLDINMPDINGIEVAKQIMSKDPNAKIIAISGNLDEGIKQEILNAGALEYIQKPFQNAFLWDKLDKVVDIIEGRVDVKVSVDKEVPAKTIVDFEEEIIIPSKQEEDFTIPTKFEEKIIIPTKSEEEIEIQASSTSIEDENDVKAVSNNEPVQNESYCSETEKDIDIASKPSKTIKLNILDDEDGEGEIIVAVMEVKEQPIEETKIIQKKETIITDDEEEDDLLSENPIISTTNSPEKEEIKSSVNIKFESQHQEDEEEIIIHSSTDVEKDHTEIIEEDKFKFSSEIEFDIEKELPTRKDTLVKSKDDDLVVILPDEEVGDTYVEYTEGATCINKQDDEYTSNVTSLHINNKTTTFVDIDKTSNEDNSTLEFEIVSKDTNNTSSIKRANEDELEFQINPHHKSAVRAEHGSNTLKTPKTEYDELKNNNPNYNTVSNEVDNSHKEESKTPSIAPPRSKVLKEMYSDMIHTQYKTTYADEPIEQEPVEEPKKEGLLTSLKKLFNKK